MKSARYQRVIGLCASACCVAFFSCLFQINNAFADDCMDIYGLSGCDVQCTNGDNTTHYHAKNTCQTDADCETLYSSLAAQYPGQYTGLRCIEFPAGPGGCGAVKRCAKKCSDLPMRRVGSDITGEALALFNRASFNMHDPSTGSVWNDYYGYAYISAGDRYDEALMTDRPGLWFWHYCPLEAYNVPVSSKHCNVRATFWTLGVDSPAPSYTVSYNLGSYHCTSCPAGYRPGWRSVWYAIQNSDSVIDGMGCDKLKRAATSLYDWTSDSTRTREYYTNNGVYIDEWVACFCVEQSGAYCSQGCKIPYDAGCYKNYYSGDCYDQWYHYGAEASDMQSISTNSGVCNPNMSLAEKVNGCFLTWSSLSSWKDTQRCLNNGDLPENSSSSLCSDTGVGGCWIKTDSSVTSVNGRCVMANAQSEYCDSTGCFSMVGETCDSNWMNQTTN